MPRSWSLIGEIVLLTLYSTEMGYVVNGAKDGTPQHWTARKYSEVTPALRNKQIIPSECRRVSLLPASVLGINLPFQLSSRPIVGLVTPRGNFSINTGYSYIRKLVLRKLIPHTQQQKYVSPMISVQHFTSTMNLEMAWLEGTVGRIRSTLTANSFILAVISGVARVSWFVLRELTSNISMIGRQLAP